jgi:hypothetical protein
MDAKSSFGRNCYILCLRLNETLSRPKVRPCQRNVSLDVKITTIYERELVLGPNIFWMHFGHKIMLDASKILDAT